MTIPEQNRQKITELIPEAQWAAGLWLDECERLNLKFRISEAYRTPQRQKELYAQGRTKSGAIVTYTLNSMHTQRLAVDLYPLNCSYASIEKVAAQFGIQHPFASGKFRDLPHFEFQNSIQKPQPIPTPEARLKGLERRLKTTVGEAREMILRLIERLKQRIY